MAQRTRGKLCQDNSSKFLNSPSIDIHHSLLTVSGESTGKVFAGLCTEAAWETHKFVCLVTGAVLTAWIQHPSKTHGSELVGVRRTHWHPFSLVSPAAWPQNTLALSMARHMAAHYTIPSGHPPPVFLEASLRYLYSLCNTCQPGSCINGALL